ncbi:MAG: pitrilysin family protein [Candidatus Aminicenantales bacterium]
MNKIWRVCGWILLFLATSVAQERFRKSPPIPDPLLELQLPRIESTMLMNGLTIAVAPRSGQPFFGLELVMMAGESQSPDDLPGLASFTAEMLTRGSSLVSAAGLEERIEAIGGTLNVSTTPDCTHFSFQFLEDYLDRAMEILSLMVLQPGFSDREIVTLRRILSYDLRQKQRDPEFIGRRQLLRVLFKEHPYRRICFSEDVFRRISRKDIQSFYDLYYRPNNAVLVLTGNLDLAVAVRKVSHVLNTWPRKEVGRLPLPSPDIWDEDKICFVDLPRAREATLIVGNVIFPLADPDFFPFAVLNQVLGGTPFSRLFMNLRETKEYAYNAFSEMDLFRSGGVYVVTARVIPSAVFASSGEILSELGRVARDKISTFELEQAKSYLIGNFPLQLSRPGTFSRRVADLVTFSLSDAYWNRIYDSIMQVDADRIFEVAQKYFRPRPVVVVVGDKDVLLDHLREIDRLDVYDLKGALLYTLIKGVEE